MDNHNMSFFHPTLDQARAGIKAPALWSPEKIGTKRGILLGSDVQARHKGKKVFEARKGSKVVWLSEENQPLVKNDLALAGSVLTVPTAGGGFRHFICRQLSDGKCLVLVQTGLLGNVRGHIKEIMEQASRGNLPAAHGTFALDDGSKHVDGSARHIKWWVPKTKLDGTDIPARRMDLWEVPNGAELLVGDIFAGRECRIVVQGGVIRKVDAPSNGRKIFEELEAKRKSERDAERQRRNKVSATSEETAPAKSSGLFGFGRSK